MTATWQGNEKGKRHIGTHMIAIQGHRQEAYLSSFGHEPVDGYTTKSDAWPA